MQTIVTKYIRAMGGEPAKTKAVWGAGVVDYFPWDDSRDAKWNHIAAAQKLAEQLKLKGKWAMGALPQTPEYAYCFVLEDGGGFLV